MPPVEPAPPPITITNPNAPAGAHEVLGSDGGWRASPYQRLVAVLTAAIVAVLVTGVQEVRHVRHEDALDAAAVADVAFTLSAVSSDYFTFDPPELTVTNAGRQPVRITEVQLEGPGYRRRTQDQRLGAGEGATVNLSSTKPCSPQVMTERAGALRIRARTSRGDVVERTAPLPPQFSVQLGFFQRVRCGYLLPSEALQSQLVDVRVHGHEVVARVDVINESVLPVTLSGLPSYPGVEVTTPLPVTVPRRAFLTGHSGPQRLTITVRVTDCVLLRDVLADFDPFDGGFPGTLDLRASNGYRQEDVTVQLSSWRDEAGVPRTEVADRLRALCRGG